MVEGEARRALDVVVPAVAEKAVRADDDLLGASRQLDRDELLLVVLLEGGLKLGDDVGLVYGEGLDIWSANVELGSDDAHYTRCCRRFKGDIYQL